MLICIRRSIGVGTIAGTIEISIKGLTCNL